MGSPTNGEGHLTKYHKEAVWPCQQRLRAGVFSRGDLFTLPP
jgi:hypothetical protein